MKNRKCRIAPKLNSHVLSVHFEYSDPAAEAVSIAGTFNDWQPNSTPMISLGFGRWVKDLTLAPGTYEYRFVVDGAWLPDRRATETSPNPYGGLNSVVKVGNSTQSPPV